MAEKEVKYKSIEDLPEKIRKALPEAAQKIFLAVFAKAENGDTDPGQGDSFAIAWGAVKKSYEKNEKGEWVKKKESASESAPIFFFAAEAAEQAYLNMPAHEREFLRADMGNDLECTYEALLTEFGDMTPSS